LFFELRRCPHRAGPLGYLWGMHPIETPEYTAYLHAGKEQSLLRRHPWVFSGAIRDMRKGEERRVQPPDGARIRVCSKNGEVLGTGHYQKGSIAIRMIAFGDTPTQQSFWNQRLAQAWQYRNALGLTQSNHTNAFRLIHAEGDGLPGLIADFYNGTLVLQCHTLGMYQSLQNILEAAQNALGARLTAVYDKSADVLGKHLQEPIRNRLLWGTSGDGEVLENGHRFKVDWVEGQKTGFFLDQRDNRSLLGKFAQGRSVLNTFCYSGGFSVYAHAAGAKRVVSVDVSKPAIALTDENIALNPGPGLHESHATDVFKYLEQHTETFDVVVLDPPAFAKHLSARHQALQGYKRLNALALQRMPAGSFLFTFSCSQVVDRNLFEGAVLSAAIQANRQVRIVHHLSQPADHAPSLFHPEGHYLKGLVLYVE